MLSFKGPRHLPGGLILCVFPGLKWLTRHLLSETGYWARQSLSGPGEVFLCFLACLCETQLPRRQYFAFFYGKITSKPLSPKEELLQSTMAWSSHCGKHGCLSPWTETSEESGGQEQLPHARGHILTAWYWLSVPAEFKVYHTP